MMAEQVDSFIDGVIENTQNGKYDWRPLSGFNQVNEMMSEIENGRAGFDPLTNSVRVSDSYYFEAAEGYVFLLRIYHGDPEVTSPQMDTLALMVKINSHMPLDNLSYFSEEEQYKLELLKQLVDGYVEDKYCYPDCLYEFMSRVLKNVD